MATLRYNTTSTGWKITLVKTSSANRRRISRLFRVYWNVKEVFFRLMVLLSVSLNVFASARQDQQIENQTEIKMAAVR